MVIERRQFSKYGTVETINAEGVLNNQVIAGYPGLLMILDFSCMQRTSDFCRSLQNFVYSLKYGDKGNSSDLWH